MKIICKRMKYTILQYPLIFAKSMALVTVITFFNVLIPYGMRAFINSISVRKDMFLILAGIICFLAVMLINTLFEIKWYVILDEFGGNCIRDLTIAMESSLFHTCQNNVDSRNPDAIKHTLYSDILDIFRVIGHHIPCLLGNIVTIAVCLAVASQYDIRLTIYIALATLGGMVVSFTSRKIIAVKAHHTNRKLKDHHALCNQYVEMLPTAKTNDLLLYYSDKSRQSISDFIQTSQKEDWTTVFWTRAISNYNTLISILLSAFLVMLSADSTVNLVFFSMISGIINAQSQSAELLFQQIIKSEVSFENVERLCDLPPVYGDRNLGRIRTLDFKKVSFAYKSAPGKNIINDLDDSFRQGDFIMLSGGNGSGKSTFIKLITGLYAPTEGEILINEKNSLTYSHHDLNKQILYIGQEEGLLNESISDYLGIITGSQPLDSGRYKEIMEEMGFPFSDRLIEDCGKNLSVGQRKKLLILKLMLRAPEASVIILDEVMAGLDSATQGKFIAYVKRLAKEKNKIIFIIEHNANENFLFSHQLHFESGR